MSNEPTAAELQQRIDELRQKLAEVTAELSDAATDRAPEPADDAEWGEFNPG